MRLCSAVELRAPARRRARAPPRAASGRGSRDAGRASRASCTAATRTMKNSSRLLEKIARNLHRSSSGMPGSRGERQHAGVEVEPGELAVDVERRVGQVDRDRAPRGRSSSAAHDGLPRRATGSPGARRDGPRRTVRRVAGGRRAGPAPRGCRRLRPGRRASSRSSDAGPQRRGRQPGAGERRVPRGAAGVPGPPEGEVEVGARPARRSSRA